MPSGRDTGGSFAQLAASRIWPGLQPSRLACPGGRAVDGPDMAATDRQVHRDAWSGQRYRYRHALDRGSIEQALGPTGRRREPSRRRCLVAIAAFVGANDDHVLLAAPSGSFTAHPFIYKSLPYKPADLLPIARVSNTIVVVAAPASLEAKSLAELVAMARAQPGKLNWAGTTGSNEFLFAAFLKDAGLLMSKVPYRNLVEAANDLATGRIQVNATAFAIVRPQLQAGKVKLLAVTNTARAAIIPDVPTVTEAGYPDLTLDGLVGFFGPPNMPERIRDSIAADVREAMDAVVEERLNLTGQVPNFGGPADFAAAIEQQRARIAAAAKDLGIVPTQ